MRQITTQAINTFLSGTPLKISNTEVTTGHHYMLKLHGSTIARRLDNGPIEITNAGYFTNVTKERLNGIPNVHIVQKKGIWYLNNNAWNGEWIQI